MNSLNFGMIHTCRVLSDTGITQNAAGSPISNIVSTEYNCLFANTGSTANASMAFTEAGNMITLIPFVFLPADAIVSEGDFISTTDRGWKGTYEVQNVDAPEQLFNGVIDHVEAFLKEVAKRG